MCFFFFWHQSFQKPDPLFSVKRTYNATRVSIAIGHRVKMKIYGRWWQLFGFARPGILGNDHLTSV